MAVPVTKGKKSPPLGPIVRQATITPNDSTDLDPMPVGIRCNAAGAICVVMRDDQNDVGVTHTVLASEIVPGLIRRVKSTGTTVATANIIGLYTQ